MPRIPESELTELKASISLERLVRASGVALKKKGADLVGRCPFHKDKTPSLVVTPATNLWHCLGACSAGGSVVDWVMRAERCSFREAVARLRADSPVATSTPLAARAPQAPVGAARKGGEEKAADAKRLQWVARFYHQTLKQSPWALKYLKRRGIDDPEAIEHFKLGYSNRTLGFQLPRKRSEGREEQRQQLQRIGVFRRSGHEHLVGSIVVPLLNKHGEVVQMYGRKVRDNLRAGTSSHLYLGGRMEGVFNREGLKGQSEVILCESLIDALTFWCAGMRNVTACYGAGGFTDEVRALLTAERVKRITIAFDRDEAGEAGALKVANELMRHGKSVRIAKFPHGMDANSYALKVKPAEQSLALVVNGAEWVGGSAPRSGAELAAWRAERPVPVNPNAALNAMSAAASARAAAERSAERSAAVRAAAARVLTEQVVQGRLRRAGVDVAAERGASPVAFAVADGVVQKQLREETGVQTGSEHASAEGVTAGARGVAGGDKVAAGKPIAKGAEGGEGNSKGKGKGNGKGSGSVNGACLKTRASNGVEVGGNAVGVGVGVGVAAAGADSAVIAEAGAGAGGAGAGAAGASPNADEVRYAYGDRTWRVRGLARNERMDALKVNLFVSRSAASRDGGGFHVDTVELYNARQRTAFVKQAAEELGCEERIVKRDLGRVLLALEQRQAAARKEAEEGPRTRTPKLTEAEAEEALALLKAPELTARIARDMQQACGIVGERSNLLVGYLAAVSRKLERPLAIVIQSSSAAGKSSLMDAILSLVPEEDRIQYSAMTGQSLFYMGEQDLKHRILAIVEEEGAERASYALKLLQSEGQLTIASTGKDPQSGRHVTQEYHVEGPVMIMLTTTAIDIDEELLNRCLVLTVDEGASQTRLIQAAQRRGRTLAGKLSVRAARAESLKRHQNAQRLLRPLMVVNPYAEELSFASHRTRLRRDHAKYLTLIEVVTLVHQYQRPVKTVQHGGQTIEYIEVERSDIALADELFADVLRRSVDELPPQTRKLLSAVRSAVEAVAHTQGIGVSDVRFTRREVREWTQTANTQVHVHLGRLEAFEYVLAYRGGVGRRVVYQLTDDDASFGVGTGGGGAGSGSDTGGGGGIGHLSGNIRPPFGGGVRKVYPNKNRGLAGPFGLGEKRVSGEGAGGQVVGVDEVAAAAVTAVARVKTHVTSPFPAVAPATPATTPAAASVVTS